MDDDLTVLFSNLPTRWQVFLVLLPAVYAGANALLDNPRYHVGAVCNCQTTYEVLTLLYSDLTNLFV